MLLIILTLILLFIVVLFISKYFQWRRFIKSFSNSLDTLNLKNKPHYLNKVPYLLKPLNLSVYNIITNIKTDSTKDKLTGLANRFDMNKELEKLLPNIQGFLIIIDIYQFRYINDYFGFVVGDTLLIKLTERLIHLDYQINKVAKLEGDEFIVYLRNIPSDKDIYNLKEKLQQPFIIGNIPISLRLQFGCLKFDNNTKYHSLSTIFSNLEFALRKARNQKSLIGFYYPEDAISRRRELILINSLAKGLENDEFYLMFQPKQEIKSGKYTQVEALMRWNHPELGIIPPSEFIPLAEYTGMIELISQWTLTKVLKQQVKWRQQGLNIQVAVNLSTRDITSQTLYQEIKNQLKYYQLPPEVLVIEITESTLMDDISNGVNTLSMMQKLGIKLAIDDFGTGHSSLAYLKHLPIDEVKIDKAFIEDLETDIQASHIMEISIMLAKKLNLEVTVEGVETKNIWDLLVFMGVDKIQGDYCSRPLSAADLEIFWQSHGQEKQQFLINKI